MSQAIQDDKKKQFDYSTTQSSHIYDVRYAVSSGQQRTMAEGAQKQKQKQKVEKRNRAGRSRRIISRMENPNTGSEGLGEPG